MTTYLDRLLIVFPIAGKRSGGAHLQELIEVAPGREIENLIPLDLAAVSQYAGQFNLGMEQENNGLRSNVAQLQQQVQTLQAERDAAETGQQQAQAALQDFQQQAQAHLENLQQQATQQLTEANARIQNLQTELAAAQTRITQLLEQLPFSPRVMEASAFVARIQPGELLLLLKSSDAQVQAIGAMLNEWVENDWPIVLDSPEMQQAIGYLALTGLITQERAAELLRDCSRDDAYVADQSGEGAQLLQMNPEVSNGQ